MRAKTSPTAQPQLPPAGRSWPMPIGVRPIADDVPQTFAAARAEFPSSPSFQISNRQWLARLETSVIPRKQTSEANSNRHFWEGYCARTRARISSRFGCLALNSTPHTTRSRNHRNSFKTLARAHFYYVQMDQIPHAIPPLAVIHRSTALRHVEAAPSRRRDEGSLSIFALTQLG